MFLLDPSVTFLNHGSFGAMPASVRDVQRAFQDQMEREPVDFLARKLPDLLAVARASAAGLIGARPDDVVFVPNATTGINAVVDAVPLEAGDEILTTTHRYDAVGHTLQRRALQRGATVVEAAFPYTDITTDHIVDAVTSAMSPRTRLLVIDAITSPTALVLPLEPIIAAAQHRGIPVLVDGAHAPGHIPVDVSTPWGRLVGGQPTQVGVRTEGISGALGAPRSPRDPVVPHHQPWLAGRPPRGVRLAGHPRPKRTARLRRSYRLVARARW